MSVRLRFRRFGNRNRPFYRLVATDQRKGTTGKYIENLGWYDPALDGLNFNLKLDRIEYWEGCGAQPSDSVKSVIKKARKYQPRDGEPAPEPFPEETPAAKEEAPVAKEAPKEEAPAAKEEAPAAKEETPAKEEASAKEEKAPEAKEETPKAEEKAAEPEAKEEAKGDDADK